MQFDTYTYAIFLPIVFLLYWALKRRLAHQNVLLLAASYLFYGWWDWRFLGLIVLTSCSTYATALLMERGHKRLWASVNIALNLGVLFTFKYFNFFADTFNAAVSTLGWHPSWPTLNLVLPVGISFYTLQALSYTFDVYRDDIKPTRDAVAFFVYVAFFPQLVAGPIERASQLLPQLLSPRRFNYDEAVTGMRQILWGLAKKIIIADQLAGYVDYILYHPSILNPGSVIMGALLFAVQIYADFSGYSDIAIGSARLLGIRLTANFRFPYFSRDMKELWQRWHISLMQWLRNYVYFPLGGSRRGKWRTCLNVMTVFFLSGVWHGASWNFILWGLGNGLLMLPYVFSPRKHRDGEPTWRDLPRCLWCFLASAALFLVFRLPSMADVADCLHVLAHGNYMAVPLGLSAWLYIIPFFAVEWAGRRHEFPIQVLPVPTPIRWAIYWTLLALIAYFSTGRDIQYIYFQF